MLCTYTTLSGIESVPLPSELYVIACIHRDIKSNKHAWQVFVVYYIPQFDVYDVLTFPTGT